MQAQAIARSAQLKDSGHSVRFYEERDVLIKTVSDFITTGLESGSAAVVIMMQTHREDLVEHLTNRGLDLAAMTKAGQFVLLDSAETLAQFIVNDWPDERRFVNTAGGVLSKVQGKYSHIRAYGDMVTLLCAAQKPNAAVRLEKLWNDLGKSYLFSLLCGYPMEVVRTLDGQQFRNICHQHSHIVPPEPSKKLTSSDGPFQTIMNSFQS